jgi:hypothetical protein
MRRGIANEIALPATGARATIDVTVRVSSEVESRDLPARTVQLVGPGDIIGVNSNVVVRTEPRNWITDFEPNYLACVEFYDEDFPWRYTPAPPDSASHRLIPWLSLLLLKESEFTRNDSPGRPLPSVTLNGVTAAAVLPPADQLWAWAHVHMNGTMGSGHSPDLATLDSTLQANPDRGFSRLMSPRRLEPNTGYYGIVIPTFEVGRKAGLGETVADAESGLALSWDTAVEFPVYFQWFFRTGAAGDFEELVRALRPRAIDPRVGIRDLDIQQPGFLLPPIVNPPDDLVGLEGALLSPFSKPDPLVPASNFPPEVEKVVNLADDAQHAGTGDPVVTAPLYGRWHALVERISADPGQRHWVNELNIDPRWRAAAGFGTRVIQVHQEEYMKLAWEQVGDVLAANRRVTFVQFAMQASQFAFQRHVVTLPAERALAFTSPVHRKVMGSPITVHSLVNQSRLPRAALSGAFRKQMRPRGLIARRAFANLGLVPRDAVATLVQQLNAGTVSAAPPLTPPGGPTLEGSKAPGPDLPQWLKIAVANRWLLLIIAWIVCALLFIIGPSAIARLLAIVAAGTAYAMFKYLERLAGDIAKSQSIPQPADLTPEAVLAVPPQPSFVLAPPGNPIPPVGPPVAPPGTDSVDARDFRTALLDFHVLLSIRVEPLPAAIPLDLNVVSATVLGQIEPVRAFPKRIGSIALVGGQTIGQYIAVRYLDAIDFTPDERIVPVMAYPDIKRPMYEPLRDLSSDMFVPNLALIEPNTISLMVRNQPFIEAYMVGLNQEFGRELLWREYPTDQRPSTFRQFWDVSHALNVDNLDPKAFEESLRDITKLHEWQSNSQLGDHNNRHRPGDPPETAGTPLAKRAVALVIRGDLLKRYPNTIIYAQRARWGTTPQNSLRLVLWDETGEKSETDPADPNIRYPLYRASVSPDIHFIGFDLYVEEVRGDPALDETAQAKSTIAANRLGWFFAIKQVAGEPRFGLDEHPPDPGEADPLRWDNLSWDNLGAGVKIIDLDTPFPVQPLGTTKGGVDWATNAADMASILYQKPVLVAVHAREMLRSLN